MNKQKDLDKRIAVLDIHSPLYLKSAGSKRLAGDVSDLRLMIDLASEAGFSAVQLLPIQDTGLTPSPYMGKSLFSYNPVYFSDGKEEGDGGGEIDYRSVYKRRTASLTAAAKGHEVNLADFSRQQIAYALFCYFHQIYKYKWPKWPTTIRHGRVEEILGRYPHLITEISQILVGQSILGQQWEVVASHAKKRKIDLIMDKPIYPIHNSAEVWANQELYYLNPDGSLEHASGCDNPRDPFGAQYWGHAVYRFKEKPAQVIDYFVEQIRFMARLSKYIRLDHTLALIWKYYLIDPESREGKHVGALKHKLFDRLIEEFPDVYFIAEDLGYISQQTVDAPLQAHGIPGMRCLQWYDIKKYSRVSEYPKLSMAMTASHDLDSLPNWWRKLRRERKMIFGLQMGGLAETESEQVMQLIGLAFNSKSNIASVTLRDLLGDLRRFNHPSSKNYFDWKLRMKSSIEEIDFSEVKKIIFESNRLS